MTAIYDLWMQAWGRSMMDSQVDVDGNSHDPWAVIATLKFTSRNIVMMPTLTKPSRDDVIQWLTINGLEDEIEYLMEE